MTPNIVIFFVPGMFGSTVEYVLRNYSNELDPIDGEVLEDGSMHSFRKFFHPSNDYEIKTEVLDKILDNHPKVITPIYPYKNKTFDEIWDQFSTYNVKPMIIFQKDFADGELNLLFQHYKIIEGSSERHKRGYHEIFHSNRKDVQKWNTNYNTCDDMKLWEFREYFSYYYVNFVKSFFIDYNKPGTLTLPSTDLLENPHRTLLKIFDYFELTITNIFGLNDFVNNWRKKQQYIIDEYNILPTIVNATLNKDDFSWKKICPLSEAIIQNRLRENGFEIQCNGLDIFPTNSKELYNLLIPCYN